MKNRIILVVFFVVFINQYFSQLPNYVPTNGLIGWWPLNNNLLDYSGNTNNGSNSQTVTGTTDRFNNPNKAYYFNGSSSYVTIPHDGYSTFTLSMWYFMDQNLYPQYPLITSNPLSYEIFFTGTAGLQFGSTGGGGYGNIPLTPWGVWTHLVCIYTQNDNKVRIYKNSNLIVTHNINEINTAPGNHILGKLNSSFLTGKLDDIGLWNRALTQNEINNLYNSTLDINEHKIDSISVFPNPFNGKIQINTNSLLNSKFSIVNNIGLEVFQGIITNESLELDLNFLSKGTYFIQFENLNKPIEILNY